MIDLQRCQDCGAVAYPAAERCAHCLSDRLVVEPVDAAGRIVSWTIGHVSFDQAFQKRTPWPIALVRLNAGPLVYAHVPLALARSGAACTLSWVADPTGRAVLAAAEPGAPPFGPFEDMR
jgi:uncharacterized protein